MIYAILITIIILYTTIRIYNFIKHKEQAKEDLKESIENLKKTWKEF